MGAFSLCLALARIKDSSTLASWRRRSFLKRSNRVMWSVMDLTQDEPGFHWILHYSNNRVESRLFESHTSQTNKEGNPHVDVGYDFVVLTNQLPAQCLQDRSVDYAVTAVLLLTVTALHIFLKSDHPPIPSTCLQHSSFLDADLLQHQVVELRSCPYNHRICWSVFLVVYYYIVVKFDITPIQPR